MKPSLTLAALAWTVTGLVPSNIASVAGGPEVGKAAPEIDGKAWLNHLGTDPNLASLRGQAVLIEFWATW